MRNTSEGKGNPGHDEDERGTKKTAFIGCEEANLDSAAPPLPVKAIRPPQRRDDGWSWHLSA